MNDDKSNPKLEEQSCPKRLWVMGTLSDDELLAAGEDLPPGLAFHLSRCGACQTLADELMAARNVLQAACSVDMPGGLTERAAAVATRAIANGAPLTGRVDVADDTDMPVPIHVSRALRWGTRLAVAASVAFASVLVGLSYLGPDQPFGSTPVAAPDAQFVAGADPAVQQGDVFAPLHQREVAPKSGEHARLARSQTPQKRLARYETFDAAFDDVGVSASLRPAVVLPDRELPSFSFKGLIDSLPLVGSTSDRSEE